MCGHWAGDWCSPCIGAGFDTLTFQSMIVHFFVALAQKNCPRALASTTSRSDWRRHSGPANLFYSINKFYSHPASRDQLTDQEQCEAAKRITTCAKILPIAGPKTKRQKCSGFQGPRSSSTSSSSETALQNHIAAKEIDYVFKTNSEHRKRHEHIRSLWLKASRLKLAAKPLS